jgi:hypothetical protein
MKTHTQRAQSPYKKYAKRPYDYSAMYSRNPHLRRPLTSSMGSSDPHNEAHLKFLRDQFSMAPAQDSALAA